MKKALQLVLMMALIFACKENTESAEIAKTNQKESIIVEKQAEITEKPSKKVKTDLSWKGEIQGKIPVFVHFQIQDSVVLGEIIYLNTKSKTPIKLVGQQMEGGLLRILEFEKSGNITGIITGLIHGNDFKGEWFSPKSRKDLPITLVKYDTLVPSINISAKTVDCFGKYRYQFSENGSMGGFTLSKSESTTMFEIGCFTAAPAHNMAIIEETEVNFKNNRIVFNILEEESCNFEVKFYNGFALIKYTNGDCNMGYFGHNAHVDGIFLKTK